MGNIRLDCEFHSADRTLLFSLEWYAQSALAKHVEDTCAIHGCDACPTRAKPSVSHVFLGCLQE